MCIQAEIENSPHKHKNWNFIYYIFALIAAFVTGYADISWLHNVAELISKIFVNSFKCLSLPIIALSIIVTFCQSGEKAISNRVWKRSILYTFSTTIIAASVACLLYLIIRPISINAILDKNEALVNMEQSSYFAFIIDLFPENILQPFIEQKVLSIVLLAVLIGFALRNIKNSDARNALFNITKGIHEIFLTLTTLLIKLMPFGLYGFVAIMLIHLKQGVAISGLWSYFMIIIGANVIQGFIILPLFLLLNKQQPYKLMRKAMPALSVAFFSKSSTGTLPVTIDMVEKKMQVSTKISRFVLPLCTTLNMNGCAAFIFVTVIYLMQCNVME